MSRLYSEKIDVRCEGVPKEPVSFVWRDEEYKIADVQEGWHDYGFGQGGPRRKTWRLRRHRNFYRVSVEGGRVFEIYLERGGNRRYWVLYRELD